MVQVRSSAYRHVYGEPTRKDKCHDNIRLTNNAFDANLAKSNGKYISLNWDASGGGSFAVIPTSEKGKLPDRFPLFDGHRGPVLDTAWNPFDDNMVVSASDDGTIGVWRVPDNFSVFEEYGSLDDCKDIAPVKFLTGHGKKVGHLEFNPTASSVLASASLDNTIKIWDVESGDVLFTLKHPSFVTSFSWNYDGSKIASVAKDKVLRVWNVREEKVTSEGKGHAGAKGSRVIWLGDQERVLTTGFSLISDREMALWDAGKIAEGPIGGFRGLDPSSGIVIPHYDPMTSMIYLGGRGDGKIVYYELVDDELYDLFAFNSTSPQRGLGWVPNKALDPQTHEVARVYKVHEKYIEPISFRVPLKTEGFLESVYKEVEAGQPALSSAEWKSGKTKRPLVKDWKLVHEGKETVAKEATQSSSTPSAKTGGSDSQSSRTEGKQSLSSSPIKNSSRTSDGPNEGPNDAKPDAKTDAKTETKQDAKQHGKADAKSDEIAVLDKAEKQDSYDVLQSNEVKSFLAKNREDSVPQVSDDNDDSAWDEELVEKPQEMDLSATENPPSHVTLTADTEQISDFDKKDKNAAKNSSSKDSASQLKIVSKETTREVFDDDETADTKIVVRETTNLKAKDDAAAGSDHSKLDAIIEGLQDLTARVAGLEAALKRK